MIILWTKKGIMKDLRFNRKDDLKEKFHQVNKKLKQVEQIDWDKEWQKFSIRLQSLGKQLELQRTTLSFQ
jgi:hypothetical protein